MSQPSEFYPSTMWSLVVHCAGDTDPARRDASWRRLLVTYHDPIERTLRARLRTPHLRARSAELVDEFFSYLAAGNVLARADRAYGPFRRFIQGVVRNFVLDLARREQHRGASDLAAVGDLGVLDDEAEAADEVAWCQGMVRAALRALAERNPRQAAALTRRYGIASGDGRDCEETPPSALAAELHTTAHGVHELLRRAKRELRQILARRVADSLHGSDASSYHADYLSERARMEQRASELWPGILQADADDVDAPTEETHDG